MSDIHFNQPIDLDSLQFKVRIDESSKSVVPVEMQGRVDAKFTAFADKAEQKSGKRPTKGEIGVLKDYSIIREGLNGVCTIATFDQVLYFARSQIPEGDYAFGRENIGFPLASWGVLTSKNGQLLFVRKKGAEGAYQDSPFSAFGGLVSIPKDRDGQLISPQKHLERCVGGEIGDLVWQRKQGIFYLGFNVYDENSDRVNNGYDTVWDVAVDASMEEILKLLNENPQFELKSNAIGVNADPVSLRKFAALNKMTASGLAGIFSYIGSRFGLDELIKQNRLYEEAKGPSGLTSRFVE